MASEEPGALDEKAKASEAAGADATVQATAAPPPPASGKGSDGSGNADDREKTDASPDDEKSKGVASAITVWSSAFLVLIKAIMALVMAVIVVVAMAKVLWRSYSGKHVAVEVDPVAQKFFNRLGIEFDLRSMLVTSVSQRMKAVESIVKMQGLEIVENQEPVSLKVVGVDISTRDWLGILESIIGVPPRYHVQIGVTCSKPPCDLAAETGPGSSAAPLPPEVRLLVDFKGGETNERISRLIHTTNPALRHDLRASIDLLGEQILLMTNRQAASVLFLNMSGVAEFRNDRVDYASRAAAATFDDLPRNAEQDCIARNVYGASLEFRGDLEAAAIILAEAGQGPGPPSVCRVHCLTNLARIRITQAIGERSADAAARRFGQATAALDSLTGKAPSRQEEIRVSYFRIAIARAQIVDALNRGTTPKTSPQPATIGDRLASIITSIAHDVPPGEATIYSHVAIRETLPFARQADRAMPLQDRVRTSLSLLRLIDRYLVHDPAPQRLLLAQGAVQRTLAVAMKQAETAPPETTQEVQRALAEGRDGAAAIVAPWDDLVEKAAKASLIAFQTAGKAAAFPPPIENSSALEPPAREGDLYFLFDEITARAGERYTTAVQAYVDDYMPSADTYMLAETVAKWAIWSTWNRSCDDATAEPSGPLLAALGAQPRDGLCSFAAARRQPTNSHDSRLGVWSKIYPLVMNAVRSCAPARDPSSPPPSFEQRLKIIECVEERSWQAEEGMASSSDIDREIDRLSR
jgi:hypothetical protein